MNVLPMAKKVQILNLMVECVSLRAISRIVDCSINTVSKILVETGTACQAYHDEHVRNLECKRLEVDEIWSFCYAKKNKLPPKYQRKRGFGDAWTWVAIDPDTKLIPAYLTGERNYYCAEAFMHNLKGRLKNRPQITSDGLPAYQRAAEVVFRGNVDFGMLIKDYERDGFEMVENRYIPKDKLTISKKSVIGTPDMEKLSTSSVERCNLTIRTSCKRFARRTNAHSKKIENHNHALAINFFFYNYGRIHSSIKVTPAMEAGLSDHVWTLEEILTIGKK